MFKYIKNIDAFGKNIIIVFLGTSLANFFNLLYQLLIAHRLCSVDFAAFNSLLAIFMLVSSPLANLQTGIVKYIAEFNARAQTEKIKNLLSVLFRKTLLMAVLTFFIFSFASIYILSRLKIPSIYSAYILAILLGSSWVTPVFSGALQGLELFKWLVSVSIIAGALKLILAFIFIALGFNISGALGAFLVASLIGLIVSFYPLRRFLAWKATGDGVDFKAFTFYLFPVAISSFCFIGLVSFDMVLVKYFFIPVEAGFYSLAQMVGKIFLFLPGAISIVMFPITAGLNAKNMDTQLTLKRSLLYAAVLCGIAVLGYNLFPAFILKVLTGKDFAESIALGRLFGISMTFFALLNILISYFISIKDTRFIKYLFLFTLLQYAAIVFFHRSLAQVQLILCLNSLLLFCIHILLLKPRAAAKMDANLI